MWYTHSPACLLGLFEGTLIDKARPGSLKELLTLHKSVFTQMVFILQTRIYRSGKLLTIAYVVQVFPTGVTKQDIDKGWAQTLSGLITI